MASDLTDRLLGKVLRRTPTATHVTKVAGEWRVARPGQCARCRSTALKGWYYCGSCAVELGRR